MRSTRYDETIDYAYKLVGVHDFRFSGRFIRQNVVTRARDKLSQWNNKRVLNTGILTRGLIEPNIIGLFAVLLPLFNR